MLFGFVKSVFESQEKFLKLGELLRFTLLQRAKEKAISVWELQNNPTFMQICLVVFDFNILRSKIFPFLVVEKKRFNESSVLFLTYTSTVKCLVAYAKAVNVLVTILLAIQALEMCRWSRRIF